MLLKSLFCLHGRDSRSRFVAISLITYAVVSLAVAAFGVNFLFILTTFLGLPLMGLTALRRLTDAAKPKALLVVLLLPLLIYLGLLSAGAHAGLLALGIIFASAMTFWGWRLAAPTLVDYRFGYYGPVLNSPTAQAVPRRRVEPVLAAKAAEAASSPSFEVDIPAAPLADEHPLGTDAKIIPVETLQDEGYSDAELEAQRQDELRFEALTRMTQNPADFVVPDPLPAGQADFRAAHGSRVEHSHIALSDVEIDNAALATPELTYAAFDSSHQQETQWHVSDDEPEQDNFNDQEHAEEVRRRRAEAKESGSMTELFRGLLEFVAPLRRFLVLPRVRITLPKVNIPKPPRHLWRPAGAVVGAVLLVALVWGLWPSGDDTNTEAASFAAEHSESDPAKTRVQLELPDGFSVALEQNVLILRWLGEQGQPQTLWSLASATGDKSCSALEFNNGTEYRPVTVTLKSDSATEAYFSPLDTQGIIVDLARRGSISLCGYRFSLKGSQAVLEQNRTFGNYLAQ